MSFIDLSKKESIFIEKLSFKKELPLISFNIMNNLKIKFITN